MAKISRAIRPEAKREGESPQHEAAEKRAGDKDDARRPKLMARRKRGGY